MLVTKDADFHRLVVLLGPPPKVVWLRTDNDPTAELARLLRARSDVIRAFDADADTGFLVLE